MHKQKLHPIHAGINPDGSVHHEHLMAAFGHAAAQHAAGHLKTAIVSHGEKDLGGGKLLRSMTWVTEETNPQEAAAPAPALPSS